MTSRLVKHVSEQSYRVGELLHRNGRQLWAATFDWQSPLRSGGGPGCKGEHSDPTSSTVLSPDPLATKHAEYKRLLAAKDAADSAIIGFHQRHDPLSEAQADKARNRVNSDPGCVVCAGPAPAGHRRSGRCDQCRMRWERSGRPDLTTQRAQHQAELTAQAARIHEHEATG